MNNFTLHDLKSALFDEKFQHLFPEFKEQIKLFLKDSNCSCNIGLLKQLLKYKERIKQYFPNKQIIQKDSWKVINCNIYDLDQKLKELPKGKKMMAISRFREEITIVLNDITDIISNSEEKWKVINTNIFNLEKELYKVETGIKVLQITRYENEVTAIINFYD